MQVVNRDERQVPRPRERAPEQKAVGRVKRESPARIRLDHRQGEIPKELIEIVEVAQGPRPDVRSVQYMASYLITGCNLKFAVGITTAVGKIEDSSCP